MIHFHSINYALLEIYLILSLLADRSMNYSLKNTYKLFSSVYFDMIETSNIYMNAIWDDNTWIQMYIPCYYRTEFPLLDYVLIVSFIVIGLYCFCILEMMHCNNRQTSIAFIHFAFRFYLVIIFCQSGQCSKHHSKPGK